MKKAQKSQSKSKKIPIMIGILLLLLAGAAWALVPAGEDPQVVKVREMQQKLFADMQPGSEGRIPFEGRREAFREFREEMEKLTDQQRDKLMRENPPPFVKRMQKEISDFFELPESQRKAALDRHIDNMEKMRREMEQR